jgi:aspartate carbamoyltransferase regulatory subunit
MQIDADQLMKKHIGYIENGINLDHIPCGNAFYIMKILNLHGSKQQTGIGLNLPSKKLGTKDLIKIENRLLTDAEIDTISLFCVGSTLSVIADFKVIEKIKIALPRIVKNLVICPNRRCISHEHNSLFITNNNYLEQQIRVTCHYCEQTFLLSELRCLLN